MKAIKSRMFSGTKEDGTNEIGLTIEQLRTLRSFKSAYKNNSDKPIDFDRAKIDNVSLLNY